MGKFAMTSLKDRSLSHKGRRTRIGPRVRERVGRANNFGTKADLMTAQYSAEEREEIAELLRILATKRPLIQSPKRSQSALIHDFRDEAASFS